MSGINEPGARVAVFVATSYPMVPIAPLSRKKLLEVRDARSIGSSKDADTIVAVETLTAPSNGFVPTTIGAMRSGSLSMIRIRISGFVIVRKSAAGSNLAEVMRSKNSSSPSNFVSAFVVSVTNPAPF